MKTIRMLAPTLAALSIPFVAATPPASTAPDSKSSAPVEVRLVEHARGEAELPAVIERAVALDPFSVQSLYDLGLEPVGVQDGLADVVAPQFQTAYETTEKVGDYAEFNAEAITVLEPQVVFMTTYQWDNGGDVLDDAFPVVVVPGDSSADWPDAVAVVADAVDATDRYDELVAEFDQRAGQIATDHAEVLARTRWALAWLGTDSTFSLRGPTSNVGLVLSAAGAQFVDEAPTEETDIELSYEALDTLSSADALALPATSDGAVDEGAALIQAQPLFELLPAVEAGHVFTFTRFTPSSYGNSLVLLDEFEAALAAIEADEV